MHKLLPISILVSGVVFTCLGVNATNSSNSDVSRFFTFGGGAFAVIGLTMTLRRSRNA